MTVYLRLLRLMLPFRWWIGLAVLLAFFTVGANVGLMATSAYLISKAALTSGFSGLAVLVTAVRAFAISRAGFRYAERYISHLATFRILTRLRVWLYASVEPIAPAGLRSYQSGDLLARIAADVETLDQFYIRTVVPPLAAALVLALSFILLGAFALQLGLVLVVFLLLTGVALPLITQRISRLPATELVAGRGSLNSLLADGIDGMPDLMAFGRAHDFRLDILRLGGELEEAQLRMARVRGMSNALGTLLAGLAGLSVLLLAIPLVSHGQINGVYLALLPLTAIASFEVVQPLGAAFQQLEASRAAACRLFELIDAPAVVDDPESPLPPPRAHGIEFRGVRFRYAPDEPLVLDDFNLRIADGARVALTGPSGSGKSTLVNLLAGFWEVEGGLVCVGGNDVRHYRGEDLRELLGIVSQQTYLFNGTLRDNLLLAKGDATDAEIADACRLARIHDFACALPEGYDTMVGENGLKLSGGERQRIAIARVILKAAPILILDEATANLDPITEQSVMEGLEAFMRGRTTLIISHRRTGFGCAERIFSLSRGRLSEEGDPTEKAVQDKSELHPNVVMRR
jgi:ATP-binding cassette subfamily C protein CydC